MAACAGIQDWVSERVLVLNGMHRTRVLDVLHDRLSRLHIPGWKKMSQMSKSQMVNRIVACEVCALLFCAIQGVVCLALFGVDQLTCRLRQRVRESWREGSFPAKNECPFVCPFGRIGIP